MDRFLKEQEVAEWLGLSLAALRRFRYENRGPRFAKFGASVSYAVSDVEAWVASRPTGGGR